jgi:hypothetical protein
MTSDLCIELHLTGHREGGPHAVLSEAPEFAGNALVAVSQRRLLEYDSVRQQPLNGHRAIEHVPMLERLARTMLG